MGEAIIYSYVFFVHYSREQKEKNWNIQAVESANIGFDVRSQKVKCIALLFA